MRETLDRMLASLREFFAKMPRRNRIRIAVLAVFVIVLAIIVVSLLARTTWVVLTGTGDPYNTAQIYVALDDMEIPRRTDGNRILVPEERLGEAQQLLRAEGLMGASTFSNDYIDQAGAFGTSNQLMKELIDKQIGADLRVQIMQNRRVINALPIINTGESSPFRIQTNTKKPTASVQVILGDGGMLSQAEAQTIADMVKNSVPGIEYEDITISDQEFRSYKIGDGAQSFDTVFEQRIMYQNMLIDLYKTAVEQLFDPVFGRGNIQVQPHVKLNFDRVTETIEEFGPPIPGNEEGMMRSLEEVREWSRGWADAEGIPGTDPNGLGTVQYPWQEFDENSYYWREVIGTNYELNRTLTVIERAMGIVEEFSISVLINSDYLGEDVEPGEQNVEALVDIVSKATEASPGDVAVYFMSFENQDDLLEEYMRMQEEQEARERMERLIDQLLMYGTILALAVMVVLLVRSIIRGLRPPPEPELALADGPGLGMDILVGDEEEKEKEYEDIDINTKSSGLEQIERFIDKDPATVAQLLRNWLTDE